MIPVIVGPTGSGKTELAIDLARNYGFIVINADSRKVYKYLDIGTAKPSKEQRKFYRLIDILEPCEEFSAYKWAELAEGEIENLLKEGKRVIIEGASVLYLKALFEGFFEHPQIPKEIREQAKRLAESGEGYKILLERDEETAKKIHPNDKYRISRALEVLLATGKPISALRKGGKRPKFKPIYFLIDITREILYRRIEERAKEMFDKGLIDETKEILKKYPCFKEWGKKVVAYKQALEFLEGKYDYETAIRKKAKADKDLARRQLRFMKTLKPIIKIPFNRKELLLSFLHL
ncbi:MAG: tRNA (adenosine(37)-N6)-dimethylallyltransferase MiaA [candidate division WOR-3 bacterium]